MSDAVAGELQDGRRWLTKLLHSKSALLDPADLRAVGLIHQGLAKGLPIQRLLDRDTVTGLGTLARTLQPIFRTLAGLASYAPNSTAGIHRTDKWLDAG